MSIKVPVWKELELRVFLLESPQNEDETKERQLRLRRQLKRLRIKARVIVASSTSVPLASNNPNVEPLPPTDSLQINRLLLTNSTNTAVVFLYLPLPNPADNYSGRGGTEEEYLSALSTISDSLPPVLFVHGISPVTSTNL